MSFMFSRVALNEDLFTFSRLFHHYDDASVAAAPSIASLLIAPSSPFVADEVDPAVPGETEIVPLFAPPTLSQHYMLTLQFDDSLFAPFIDSPFARPGLYPLHDGDGGYIFG